jgi:hypothetical protein
MGAAAIGFPVGRDVGCVGVWLTVDVQLAMAPVRKNALSLSAVRAFMGRR